jgi:calcineurin-like phosphoesterase family protein
MSLWLTSDNHFWHKRIAEYCGRPADHEERMWAGLWECVQEEDTLIHLGDVSWCTQRRREEIVSRLPGKTKILLVGNHDTSGKMHKCRLWHGVVSVADQPLFMGIDGIPMFLSHRPLEVPVGFKGIMVHGHVHEKGTRYRWWDGCLIACVCVEVTEYKPVNILDIVKEYHHGTDISNGADSGDHGVPAPPTGEGAT